jgi:hypothetical protein
MSKPMELSPCICPTASQCTERHILHIDHHESAKPFHMHTIGTQALKGLIEERPLLLRCDSNAA